MLSLEEKLQIAQEVNTGPYLGWKVHKKRNIPHRTVLHYAEVIRKGLALHKGSGRPRLLDDQAVAEVLEFLSSRPDPNYSEYRALVILKCKETWLRRNIHNIEGIEPPKASADAIYRYMKMLKLKAAARLGH